MTSFTIARPRRLMGRQHKFEESVLWIPRTYSRKSRSTWNALATAAGPGSIPVRRKDAKKVTFVLPGITRNDWVFAYFTREREGGGVLTKKVSRDARRTFWVVALQVRADLSVNRGDGGRGGGGGRPWRILLLRAAYYASSSAQNFAKLCQNYAPDFRNYAQKMT